MSHDAPLLVFDFTNFARGGRGLVFRNPERIIEANRLEDVRPALRAVQEAADAGRYAAGFIAYEAAPAFEPAMAVRPGCGVPLVWFGVFPEPGESRPLPEGSPTRLSPWQPDTMTTDYTRSIAAIHEAIARGETYQVNYTIRLRAHFEGDPLALYARLRQAQGGAWGAFIDTGRHFILSASPELFFLRRSGTLAARPMKGTLRRGRWPAEDERNAQRLAASAKDRAENLMIVDLLRNDLGRVAVTGTVAVPELFTIERYRTVLQMTSTVTCRVPPASTLEELLAALFPCGSVTGAPKISTMRIIAGLETSPRNVYCGAVGMLTPGGDAAFNVAIRTVLIDAHTGAAEYGVGGGITWDSTAAGEYDEVLSKAAVLFEAWPQFDLLETLLLEDGTCALLERHLGRLKLSARYFGIPLRETAVRQALGEHAQAHPGERRRVRLLVNQAGTPRVESQPLTAAAEHGPRPVCLAEAPVPRSDRFLFHKTTNRAVYDACRPSRQGIFDVLLFNEEGELTEFTTGNLVVETDGRRWTPPLDCGLLAGTFRAELLERGEIAERVLTRPDLDRATSVWYINSVRGWVPVRLVP